jgi:hypothetical protein
MRTNNEQNPLENYRNIEYGEESKVVSEELRFKGFGLISSYALIF